MKYLLVLLLAPSILFAAVDATEVRAVRVPDAKGNMHNAGDIRDVVKNYAALKNDILADARTRIEARITALGSKTDELAALKTSIDLIEAAGGTVAASRKTLVTNSVAIEEQKKADRESERAGK
jgi:hypothetical protein